MLPLRGRERFTNRFIRRWYEDISDIGNLIIADGSETPQNINTPLADYFYAGPDTSLNRWWHKMVLAFEKVETPYAMVADNDDLVDGSGIRRCIDFLDTNPDYIACSGRIRGFWMWPDQVLGPHAAYTQRYALYDVPADYGQPTANERVLAGFQNSWSYYAVYRSECLKTIWREVYDLNLSDLQLHEKFCAMRALTLGKIKCDDRFVSYLRQYGTSAVASHNTDFARNLMESNFSKDRDAIFTRLHHCAVDIVVLRDKWATWYDGHLYRNYGGWAQVRRELKCRMPRLASLVQNRHRIPLLRWSYR